MENEQGTFLVKEARAFLESYLSGKDYKQSDSSGWLNKRHGLFVTLHTYPGNELRGCIGITEPIYPLKKAVTELAKSAATHDSRFPPLSRQELDRVTIEISILTKPESIPRSTAGELLEKITQKKDGLILKSGSFQGLFLPQVWEQLPGKKEFLENLCYKAGLFDRNVWQQKDTEIYKFRVQIFKEKEPKGKITKE